MNPANTTLYSINTSGSGWSVTDTNGTSMTFADETDAVNAIRLLRLIDKIRLATGELVDLQSDIREYLGEYEDLGYANKLADKLVARIGFDAAGFSSALTALSAATKLSQIQRALLYRLRK